MATKKSGSRGPGSKSGFEERAERQQAGGAPPSGDEALVEPLVAERLGQRTDNPEIGQYSGEGTLPLQKK